MDTFGCAVHVEWDPDAAATPLGQLAFFAEYLKVSGRFDALVADCRLHYTGPKTPWTRSACKGNDTRFAAIATDSSGAG